MSSEDALNAAIVIYHGKLIPGGGHLQTLVGRAKAIPRGIDEVNEASGVERPVRFGDGAYIEGVRAHPRSVRAATR